MTYRCHGLKHQCFEQAARIPGVKCLQFYNTVTVQLFSCFLFSSQFVYELRLRLINGRSGTIIETILQVAIFVSHVLVDNGSLAPLQRGFFLMPLYICC